MFRLFHFLVGIVSLTLVPMAEKLPLLFLKNGKSLASTVEYTILDRVALIKIAVLSSPVRWEVLCLSGDGIPFSGRRRDYTAARPCSLRTRGGSTRRRRRALGRSLLFAPTRLHVWRTWEMLEKRSGDR